MKFKNNIAENYRKSIEYIKESKKYLIVVTLLFFISFLIGIFFKFMEEEILQIIINMGDMFEGLNIWQTIELIFLNNSRTCFIVIVFGILFGIFPIGATLFNGYLLGFVSRIVINEKSFLELWRILPHGIFELPAVFISLGLGTRLGMILLKKFNKEDILSNLKNSLRTFIIIVVPLLAIAAIIEGVLIFLVK